MFPQMVARPKWHTSSRNLEKGDIMLVQDSNALRGEWKMARVTEAVAGLDGKVRSCFTVQKEQAQDRRLSALPRISFYLPSKDEGSTSQSNE